MKHLKPISGIYFLLVICVAAAFSSCRRLPMQSSTEVMDSTHVQIIHDIDTVYTPGDSIPFEVFIECDSTTNKPKPLPTTSRRSGHVSIEYALDSAGRLSGTCKADSLQTVIDNQTKIITRLRSEKQIRTEPCTDNNPGWFEKFVIRPLALLGVIALIIIAIKRF